MNARLALVAGLATACLGLEGSACLDWSAAKSSAASAKAMSFWGGPGRVGVLVHAFPRRRGFRAAGARGRQRPRHLVHLSARRQPGAAGLGLRAGRAARRRSHPLVSAATTRGPRFGPGYDPSAFRFVPWGSLEFRFIDCNRGEVAWAGPAGWGSGTREITRLSSVGELECAGKKQVHPSGARTLAGLRQRSGAWFDPTHAGEGWQVEELADGRTVVYWFTYDERGGRPGPSALRPPAASASRSPRTCGPWARASAEFDPARVRLEPWGRLAFDFTGCEAGSMTYACPCSLRSAAAGFALHGSAKLAGTSCLEGAPALPLNGTWSAGATMPAPQSEFAMATAGPVSCAAGGLGGSCAT